MKSSKYWNILILVTGLTLSTAVLGAQARNITIKGSDTMVILGQRWAETYMKEHSDVTIQVTGGGSGTGIAALVNGSTDIAEASRRMKPEEIEMVSQKQGKEVLELPVAVDGLAVYLHEQNPIDELTIEQLKGIYTGSIKNWKEVGGNDERILLYGRQNNSGTYAYFKEHVLAGADYSPMVQTLPGTAAAINAVSKDPRGIGYGGIAYAKAVKHVKVKTDADSPGIEPTMENVLEARYPISRFLFWYFAGSPSGDMKAFAEWVLSDEGQLLVEKVGYYPLREEDRQASLKLLESGKHATSQP